MVGIQPFSAHERKDNLLVIRGSDRQLVWYEVAQVNDGTGAARVYTEFAIIVCHEIRQVYRLPLRQAQGFIDSIFEIMGLELTCPSYSQLSKRLAELNIEAPRYYVHRDRIDDEIRAIAIDSTGLKRFGRGEWHQEKYELSSKASWRKLHLGANDEYYYEACVLTDRFCSDDQAVDELLEQIKEPVDHITGDGVYDKTPVYEAMRAHSPQADIVIPPSAVAVLNEKASPLRNRNIAEIKAHGRMQWQKIRHYGRRNTSELNVLRYKRILGDSMHARELGRQKTEAMIGCGVINKMTSIGMPKSYRCA